jgi:hypothetical protein
MQKHYLGWALGFMAVWVLAAPARALAYLDPGTGSYLFQILIAALAGGIFAIKLFWGRISAFFSGVFGKGKTTEIEVRDDAGSGKPE